MATRFSAQHRLVMTAIHNRMQEDNLPIIVRSEEFSEDIDPIRFRGIVRDLASKGLIVVCGTSMEAIRKASTIHTYYNVSPTAAFTKAFEALGEITPLPVTESDAEADTVVARILYDEDTDRIELITAKDRKLLVKVQHDSANARFFRHIYKHAGRPISRKELDVAVEGLKQDLYAHTHALKFKGPLLQICFHISKSGMTFWPEITRRRLAKLGMTELDI